MPSSRTGALRVAVLSNRKHSITVATDAPADALAEYDAEETVEGLIAALTGAGCEAFFLEADETLLDTVRLARPDICFNIAEGLRGDSRESQVPALLEMLGIPYTGSKVLANAISLNKATTKQMWRDAGLPTAPFQLFRSAEAALDPALVFPLFVKPVKEGSGMGINAESLVHDEKELRDQVAWVSATYRQAVLVETYLPGREFTVGVLGNRYGPGQGRRSDFYDDDGFHVLPIEEIDMSVASIDTVYNTFAKTFEPENVGGPRFPCPAQIPDALSRDIRSLTIRAFECIDALDVSRIDFRLDELGQPQLMEINTLPGLRPGFSDMWIAANAEGVAYEKLVVEILRLALERYGMATRL
jgi:D-alanine-D-alanine ligase